MDALVKILFPHGDYFELLSDLYVIYRRNLSVECSRQESADMAKAGALLQRAYDTAKMYDRILFDESGVYRHISPWFVK